MTLLLDRLLRLRSLNAGFTLAQHHRRRWRSPPPRRPLSRSPGPREREILRALREDGLAIVEGYLPAAECAALRDEIDGFVAAHPAAVNVDAHGADHRLFGFERVSAAARRFHDDPWLRDLAQLHCGADVANAATMAAAMHARPGNEGSGLGWHRDSFARQLKAIVYLSDVDQDHGPFEYVRGSAELREILRAIFRDGLGYMQNRLSAADVERVLAHRPARLQTVTGRAGSLVLANTAGIHRGAPIVQGSRHALTNYFYAASELTEKVLRHLNARVVTVDGQPLVAGM